MLAIVAALAVSLSGCMAGTFYSKEIDRDDPETYVTLITDTKPPGLIQGFKEILFIRQINDNYLSHNIAYVPPGPLVVTVGYKQGFLVGGGCMEFNAEAGQRYIIRHRAAGYAVKFWIEELETQKIVGKYCGFEDMDPIEPESEKNDSIAL